jgi:DNA repair photolyase
MIDGMRAVDPPSVPGHASFPVPVRLVRGRGAVSRPQGRFDVLRRESDPADAETRTLDSREDGEPGDDAPPTRPTRVTREHARSILSRNRSPDIFFEVSANPYRGCEHGCIYCYARPNHAWLGLSPGLDFETELVAKPRAAELLAAEIARPGYPCRPLVLGTATDAYQPLEREWRLTRAMLQVLSDWRHPVAIITKSSLIERDLDLLAPMAAQGLAAVYMTLTTLQPDLARSWEPRAPAPWRRLQTIRRLADAGVPVGVMVAPVVPFLNEPEIETVLAKAASAGARSAHYTVLRLPLELEQVFSDWLRAHHPDRADRVLARLADMRPGGRLNDARFHHRMRGEGPWADLIRMRFELGCRRVGLSRERAELQTTRFAPPRAGSLAGQLGLFDPPEAAARSEASMPADLPEGLPPG